MVLQLNFYPLHIGIWLHRLDNKTKDYNELLTVKDALHVPNSAATYNKQYLLP